MKMIDMRVDSVPMLQRAWWCLGLALVATVTSAFGRASAQGKLSAATAGPVD